MQQVKLMLQRLCSVLDMTTSQSISNVAWGLTVLQHTHNWCMCSCLHLVLYMYGTGLWPASAAAWQSAQH
jgi:hypothetical protein